MNLKGITTILLLILSNSFMTLAWYGHLKFGELKWFSKLGIISIVLVSWGIAGELSHRWIPLTMIQWYFAEYRTNRAPSVHPDNC